MEQYIASSFQLIRAGFVKFLKIYAQNLDFDRKILLFKVIRDRKNPKEVN